MCHQRVQSVNQQAGILQRVLGVCNVKIDTAGGSANEAVLLRYVSVSEAEALRAELFRRKKVLLAGGALDEFGTVFVDGSVVPSAWIVACAGGDVRSAAIAFGADPAAFDASAERAANGTAPVAGAVAAAQAGGNVLDGADELINDLRGVFGGQEVATGAISYESGRPTKSCSSRGCRAQPGISA
ncbi:MAG: PH domain-containing protein [Slackia sp.]